ncbi:unnamed protein product [Orchesella dallaii]|uniref:Uncharacterized protein n=1 Tax=Orchesella dallaii TaxID=48710 RepID=A0ABP1RGR4_9HEXA
MSDIAETASWLQIRNILTSHFRNSTIEFLWEENTSIATSTFEHCIILQCILLIFNSWWIEKKTFDLAFQKNQNRLEKRTWSYLRHKNALIVTQQKFSHQNLLLISDTTFPAKQGRNREIETEVSLFDFDTKSMPILIPTVIVFTCPHQIELTKYNAKDWFVELAVTSSILIFANSLDNFVYIGSFVNAMSNYKKDKERRFWMVKISLTKISSLSGLSYTQLFAFWIQLHAKFHYEWKESTANQCLSLSSYKNPLAFHGDQSCETYKTYVDLTNCTDFKTCYKFFSGRLKLRNMEKVYYLEKVFPFGHDQIDFLFQVLFPKVHLFDVNLSAFLSPMTMDVWVCTFLTIFTISIWLVWREGELLRQVLYWQYTVLLEQDEEYRLRKGGFWAKAIVIGWILSAILLRNFYNTSLYSMIAAEPEPNDYPHTLQEILDDKNFEILVPNDVYYEIWSLMLNVQVLENTGKKLDIQLHVAKLYANITLKACTFNGDNIETLQNISKGNYGRTYCNTYNGSKKSQLLGADFRNRRTQTVERKYDRFGIVCMRNCHTNWNIPLLNQAWMHRMVPKQMPFLNKVKVWVQNYAQFATHSFHKFLGRFVQSGLYERSIEGFRMLETLRNWQSINMRLSDRGMNNGSLFSYLLMMERKRVYDDEEKPTKLSSLRGTIILTWVMLSVALAILIFEVAKPRINEI